MASPVDCINKALSNIGDTSFIEDFSDPQNERERLANLHYESTRDELLQDFPWPFARAFAALAAVSGEVPGWEFKYRYPSDCLMAKIVTDEGGYRLPAKFWYDQNVWNHQFFPIPRYAFEVQADPDTASRIILCDVEDAYLWYTKVVSDLNQWTPLAREALEWRLSIKLANGLKADDQQFQKSLSMYNLVMSKAAAHSLNEGYPGKQPESPSIAVRA